MEGRRGADVDRVDLRRLDQLTIGPVGVGGAPANGCGLRSLEVACSDRRQLDAGHVADRFDDRRVGDAGSGYQAESDRHDGDPTKPDADRSSWTPPEDIARAIAHLLSSESSPTNGAVLPMFGAASGGGG